jgi:hypothetical protein
MTDPLGEAGAMAQAQVRAIVQNATALGLTWTRRLATVALDDPVTAIFDGDTEAIAMTSLIGPVTVDERVWVDIIPPSGNYIMARATPLPTLRARASFNLATGLGFTNVSFGTIDEKVPAADSWFTGAAPVTTFRFPETGRYAITAVSFPNITGAAGSTQTVSLNVFSTVPGWTANAYRNSWSVGEVTGTVTAEVLVNAGDTMTVSVRQNSTASAATLVWLTAVKLFGL